MARPSLLVLVGIALYAARAGAPPPVSEFPAELRPNGTGAVPANARLWIFGEDAPPSSQLGVTAVVAGAPVPLQVAALGCCAVTAEPVDAFSLGDEVQVTVTSPGGEVAATFSVDAASDGVPPALSPPAVLDDGPDALVLGVEGSDDVALAGFLARAGGDVVGAAPSGFALVVRRGEHPCVDVVALDLAGNESEPRAVCSERSRNDGGPGDAGDVDEPAPFGCGQGGGPQASLPVLWLLFPLLLVGLARRARRVGATR